MEHNVQFIQFQNKKKIFKKSLKHLKSVGILKEVKILGISFKEIQKISRIMEMKENYNGNNKYHNSVRGTEEVLTFNYFAFSYFFCHRLRWTFFGRRLPLQATSIAKSKH